MAKKLALGKGMASLIQTASHNAVVDETIRTLEESENNNKSKMISGPPLIDVGQIKNNPNQPRKIFKEKELEELSNSIKENGVIQPIIVSKIENGFELIAGERRLRASIKAGIEKIPAIIKKVTDREKMIMAIIENVQRSDLNCIEEALAYYQLMDEYKLTQDEVAKKLGKERSTIANYLRILKLPRSVVDLVQKEMLSFGHAKILAVVKERDKAIRFANTVIVESLSVRELEKLIKSDSLKKNRKEQDPIFDKKMDQFKEKLERQTGFHFALKSKQNGAGHISIKFNNEAEFNDVYEYLLTGPS